MNLKLFKSQLKYICIWYILEKDDKNKLYYLSINKGVETRYYTFSFKKAKDSNYLKELYNLIQTWKV